MKNKSFTLIELLVVIVIIGILAGIITVTTTSYISKANITKSKVFENNIQSELAVNMVSRWKLDETSGVTTPDAWGNNTGTLGDGVITSTYPVFKSEAECVTGQCMYFDGIDDYVGFNSSNSLDNFSEGITVSAWANFTEEQTGYTGYGYLVQKNINANIGSAPFVLQVYLKKFQFVIYNDTSGSGATSILDYNDGKWHFVVGACDNKNINLYVDGVNVKSQTSTFFRNNSGNISIGSSKYNPTFRPFKGSIDDVRIYSLGLSISQIKQNYVTGLNSLLANNNISQEEYNQRLDSLSQND